MFFDLCINATYFYNYLFKIPFRFMKINVRKARKYCGCQICVIVRECLVRFGESRARLALLLMCVERTSMGSRGRASNDNDAGALTTLLLIHASIYCSQASYIPQTNRMNKLPYQQTNQYIPHSQPLPSVADFS